MSETREILFRGKIKDNQEWVYGFFSKDNYGNCFIMKPILLTEVATFEWIKIIPETVGQYINYDIGEKAFEGDILKSQNGKLWIVKWMHQSWYVSNHEIINVELNKFAGNEVYTFHEYFKMLVKSKTNIKIIGNIHDNPELLQSL